MRKAVREFESTTCLYFLKCGLDQINLYKSLFRGRNDVFAIRFEKGGKSGYMPAYDFDRYHYKLHQMKGGNFQNYPDKQYLLFDNAQIIKHLNGEHLAGIYPMIEDDKSWFIAADLLGAKEKMRHGSAKELWWICISGYLTIIYQDL